MHIETITFLAAITGYAGLTANMVLAAASRHRPMHMVPVALIVFAHVLLIWHYRYEWDIAQATRNGYAGFVIFHAALLGIVSAPLAGDRTARRLVAFSFLVAAMGATGAVMRYEEVAVYLLPVLICDLAGLSALAYWMFRPGGPIGPIGPIGPASEYYKRLFGVNRQGRGPDRHVSAEYRRIDRED